MVHFDLSADHTKTALEEHWTLAPKINEYHPRDESHGWRSGDGRGGKAPLSAPTGEGKGDGRGDGGLALQPHLNQRFVNLAMSFGTTGNSRRSPCSLTEHAFLITRFLLHNPVEQGLLEGESVFQRFAK